MRDRRKTGGARTPQFDRYGHNALGQGVPSHHKHKLVQLVELLTNHMHPNTKLDDTQFIQNRMDDGC